VTGSRGALVGGDEEDSPSDARGVRTGHACAAQRRGGLPRLPRTAGRLNLANVPSAWLAIAERRSRRPASGAI
jgi:hypothetical protein